MLQAAQPSTRTISAFAWLPWYPDTRVWLDNNQPAGWDAVLSLCVSLSLSLSLSPSNEGSAHHISTTRVLHGAPGDVGLLMRSVGRRLTLRPLAMRAVVQRCLSASVTVRVDAVCVCVWVA